MYIDMYIMLHPDTARRIGIDLFEKIFIQFGVQCLEVSLSLDSSLEIKTIVLSERVVNILSIPVFLEYEMVLNKQTLIIGPFIGILHSFIGDAPVEFIEKSLYFIEHYKDIKGAILSFSFEDIVKNERKIKGYLYDPNQQKWILEMYPYPASIFKYAVLEEEQLLFLQNEFGKNFFNAYRFDKWQMYSWLIHNTSLCAHLPQTILYTKPENIFYFLNEHTSIYIKPIYGYKGIGIIKVYKNNNLISALLKQDEKIIKVEFNKIDNAHIFFDDYLTPGEYIIQKMLEITFEKNQVVDFRLILMKDQYGEWIDLGAYGRVGSSDNIVSNRSGGGKVEKDCFVLEQIYKFSHNEALAYRTQMSVMAVEAAKALDKLGLVMGRYGIDLAIDNNKNIWLIEMNHTNPNDEIGSYAGDEDLIHKIRFFNLLYAKKLAGFHKDIQYMDIKLLCGD